MSIPASVAVMVEALETLTAEIPDLQVNGYPNPQASPPCLDIYPDSPFQEGAGFGVHQQIHHWIVRARVSAADPGASAALLYRLMDVDDPASVEAALSAVDVVVPNNGSVDGLVTFSDDNAADLLGARWRVAMYPVEAETVAGSYGAGTYGAGTYGGDE